MERIEPDEIVQITQRSEGRAPLFGWIVADSPQRLLIETMVDAAFHGWRVVPTADIADLERTGWTRLASRLLRDGRHPVDPRICAALDQDWPTLLGTIERCHGPLALTRAPDTDEIFVGRVLRWLDDGLTILTIDTDGTIDPTPYPIAFADLTLVEFGSPYTRLYGAATDWEAALAAARG